MSDFEFGLLEKQQSLDARLRFAQSRKFVDPFEVIRLRRLKRVIRYRLASLAPLSALAR